VKGVSGLPSCHRNNRGPQRAGFEIIQMGNARHHGRQRLGNRRILHICKMLGPVDIQVVKFRPEGLADLPRRS
jgi:hypothetical protein